MNTRSRPHTDTRRVAHSVLIAIALIALAVIVWKLSEVITVTFGGIVGAAVLRGLALPIARRTGWSERWCLALVLLGLLIILGGLGWLFGQQVADQAAEMERLLPEATRKLAGTLDQSDAGRAVVRMIKDTAGDSKTLLNVGLAAGGVLAVAADLVLVFFLSIYFAANPVEYVNGFLRLLPPAQRTHVKAALFEAGNALRKWLLAQLMAMVVIGILVGSVMAILGVPLALLLGAIAFVLEFIPVVGAVLFTIPGVLVAFTHGPTIALYVFLAYLALQQLESNIIIPLLQRWAVRLPPALTLLSVVIGGLLLGVPGVVFATPLAVVAMTLVKTLYVEDTLEHGKW
jgi:predicted PurR-regulated permease PerM